MFCDHKVFLYKNEKSGLRPQHIPILFSLSSTPIRKYLKLEICGRKVNFHMHIPLLFFFLSARLSSNIFLAIHLFRPIFSKVSEIFWKLIFRAN